MRAGRSKPINIATDVNSLRGESRIRQAAGPAAIGPLEALPSGLRHATQRAPMRQEDAVQVAKFAIQSLFTPQSVAGRNLGNDLVNETLKNFITFAPLSFAGAAMSSLRNPHSEQGKMEQEAVYRMAQTPEAYADFANQQAKDGKISQPDANKRIQFVNTSTPSVRCRTCEKVLSMALVVLM